MLQNFSNEFMSAMRWKGWKLLLKKIQSSVVSWKIFLISLLTIFLD